MKKLKPVLIIIVGLLIVTAVPVAFGDNPYVGGYFEDDAFVTEKVTMGANFDDMDLSEIPSGEWIAPVETVCGADEGVISGYSYQSGVSLYRNGDMMWYPQVYYIDEKKWSASRRICEFDDFQIFHFEIKGIEDGKANFVAYVYKTWEEYDYNNPWIYKEEDDTDRGDDHYVVGCTGDDSKHYQFGVEAMSKIGQEGGWEIQNYDMAYYDSSNEEWKYLPGIAAQHENAVILEGEDWKLCIGNTNYTDVDIKETSEDAVIWEYQGTTVESGETLWDSSGTVSPRPYE